MELIRNEDTWIPPAQIGTLFPSYRPTFFTGDAPINESHALLATCPLKEDILIDVGITGWLRRGDALKLYEMAYYVESDVLELGCYHGLSTSILAQAIKDSHMIRSVVSVDLRLLNIAQAKRTLRAKGLGGYVRFKWGDARRVCSKLVRAKRKFGFIFIDDSHAYNDVFALCRILPDLLLEGGFCFFHDFSHPGNNDPADLNYGVSQAVYDGLSKEVFDFYGIFGCSALYRKKPPALPTATLSRTLSSSQI